LIIRQWLTILGHPEHSIS